MQNQPALLSSSPPRPLQAVAALLPEEILDSIFAQLGLNCSLDALFQDRLERDKNLGNMSVVAEGWTRPARRLLVKTVTVRSWTHLRERVPEWAGVLVRELGIIDAVYWKGGDSQAVAGALFKVLKQLPNLRRLRLVGLPFESFDPGDSASMQSTLLLPHLFDLSINGPPAPNSIVFDLLATSDHRISRLSVHSPRQASASPVSSRQLDFRGNLRFLSTGTGFYRTLVDSHWITYDGLIGLSELKLRGIDEWSWEGGEELYQVIAPTLSKLSIDSDDFAWFARFLPLLSILSRLSISGYYSGTDPNPAPLLLCLPPSLAFLQLASDRKLGPISARWTAAPSLVPAGLKQILIDYIYQIETYQQLPPIETLATNYQSTTLEFLGRLIPDALPFKTLEMCFDDYELRHRSLVQAECARLGVGFRQRLEYFNA